MPAFGLEGIHLAADPVELQVAVQILTQQLLGILGRCLGVEPGVNMIHLPL